MAEWTEIFARPNVGDACCEASSTSANNSSRYSAFTQLRRGTRGQSPREPDIDMG
ncbi:hypothetical protein BIW11_10019 [Tropilaelaps mercedesae]|uniref:Uncharacterized protein n=1 Tax=Tropilaelaps mercedesae TaxID=418985 RepID=A0A1V9XHJ4_9ACAR|nr:hypothetical protein BIW11_10019 [Tropilaelaps mercedesae]